MVLADGSPHVGTVMTYDFSKEAMHPDDYLPYFHYCLGCLVVYVAGIPFAVLMALRANKKYLYDTDPAHKAKHEDVIAEFGTLYQQYEPKYWCKFFPPVRRLFSLLALCVAT